MKTPVLQTVGRGKQSVNLNKVAEKSDSTPGMSVDVLPENVASQDEIQAFNATKRVGRRNAIPDPEFGPAIAQASEDILPQLANQLSLSDDPMDQNKSTDPQPSTSKQNG